MDSQALVLLSWLSRIVFVYCAVCQSAPVPFKPFLILIQKLGMGPLSLGCLRLVRGCMGLLTGK